MEIVEVYNIIIHPVPVPRPDLSLKRNRERNAVTSVIGLISAALGSKMKQHDIMEYIKHELERLTNAKIEVQSLFEYIHQFTLEATGSDSQNVRVERKNDILQFESHWKRVFPASLRNCFLAYCHTRWPPKFCRDHEIETQVCWDIFIAQYRRGAIPAYGNGATKNFTEPLLDQAPSTIDYLPVTPLNFDDLLRINNRFWEQLYNLHGNSIVRFVFEKCLLLLPIEESFFLAICHSSCGFNSRINDAPKHRQNFARMQLADSNIVGAGYVGRRRKMNPYDADPHLVMVRKAKRRKVKPPALSRRGKKRKNLALAKGNQADGKTETKEHIENPGASSTSSCTPPPPPPPPKRSRLNVMDVKGDQALHSFNQIQPAAQIRANDVMEPPNGEDQQNIRKCPESAKSTFPRWITPSAETLEKIQEKREMLKQKMGGKTPSSPLKANIRPQYTFINVMKNKYFKGKLDLITKETHIVVGTKELPKKLSGLILPKLISTSDTPVEITVHRISESAAKEFNLRVIPRKRRHKKAKKMQNVTGGGGISSGEISRSKLSAETGNGAIVENITAHENVNLTRPACETSEPLGSKTNDTQNDILFASTKPFDPTITLLTSSIVHCHSSGNTWPESSEMAKAIATSQPHRINVGDLLCKILYTTRVCFRDRDKWKMSIEHLGSIGKLTKLETTLQLMVRFHKRVRDLTKLMKNCVCHWIMKLSVKQQIREERKLEAEKRKTERMKERKTFHLHQNQIEVIDLTVDTHSTTFSSSPIVNSQPHSISAITAHSSSGHKNSPPAPHPDVPSFLSTTPNRSHSQRERQKLAIEKLNESIPHKCILAAISQILFLSGAQMLLDSNKNRKGFLSFVRKSVFLAGAKSALHLGQMMAMVDPEKCSWLSEINDLSMKRHLLAKVLSWLFNDYVLTIIRTCFYTTEVSNSRLQLTFYLRDTWRSISDRLKQQLVKKGSLTKVKRTEIEFRRPANARMRLVPKQNLNIRPLLSLEKSVNENINVPYCKLLLNYMCGNLAPHGISDTSSFRSKWKLFLSSWRKQKVKTLYYIRLDIRDAYPSVKIEKLKEILWETSHELGDLTAKRFMVLGKKAQTFTKASLTKSGEPNINWHTSLFRRPCIVKDTEKNFSFDKMKVMQALLATLTSNVVQIGKHKFTFSHGLPQGWCLSQALCNLYYGHMDIKYFSSLLHNKDECFFRSVDDYFYVSPNPARIAAFFHRMKCGIPDYNCNVNPDKSLTNIFVRSNIPTPLHDCDWIKFCGWRFCLASGHIARDFTSYAGTDFCSTLTFLLNRANSPEEFIYRRMGMIAPVRLKHLVLDPSINCRERILITIHEAGLVMAFRFYAACRVLFQNLTSVADPAKGNRLFQAIIWCATSLSKSVTRNDPHFYTEENSAFHECYLNVNNGSSNWSVVPQSTPARNSRKSRPNAEPVIPKCGDPITSIEISLLVYQAFQKKLLLHANNFNHFILPKMKEKISLLRKRLKNRSHYFYLVNTIGTTMPPHFRDIRI